MAQKSEEEIAGGSLLVTGGFRRGERDYPRRDLSLIKGKWGVRLG